MTFSFLKFRADPHPIFFEKVQFLSGNYFTSKGNFQILLLEKVHFSKSQTQGHDRASSHHRPILPF